MNRSEPSTLEDLNIKRDYYESALDKIPFYSQLLPHIPFPRHNPRQKMILVITFLSLTGWLFSFSSCLFPVCIVAAFLFEIKYDLREKVIEECMHEEWMLADDLARNGGDPYFPADPDHVVPSDREYIFGCQSQAVKRRFKKTPMRIIFLKHIRYMSEIGLIWLFLLLCQTLTNGEPVAWFLPANIISDANKTE